MASSHSKFSIGEAVSYGWRSVTSHLKFFIPLALVVLVVSVLFQFGAQALQGDDSGIGLVLVIVLALLNIFVQLLVGLGIVKICVDFVEKKKPSISDLFSQYGLVLRYLGSNILLILPIILIGIFAVGLSVLMFTGVIPEVPMLIPVLILVAFFGFALWWQVRLQFYVYFIVDKNFKAIPSLKKSFEVTQGHFWKLFFFGLLLGLINILGMLAFVIGLFITIPLTWVATAHVYKKLSA